MPPSHHLLPSSLLEEDDDVDEMGNRHNRYLKSYGSNLNNISEHRDATAVTTNKKRGNRNRSNSPPGSNLQDLTQEQIKHLTANFRTKVCLNGPSCKFGRNCWFAHNSEELRKPSEPLPNNLPAVHKLEKYSHREVEKAKLIV